jgi:hypothetical protein
MQKRRVTLQNDIISVMLPVMLRRHGGRKYMVAPESGSGAALARRPDPALVSALAKAKLWQMQIEAGKYKSAEALAKARKMSPSYVFRLLRLNQLSPDIKRAVLEGRQPVTMDVESLRKPFPDLWHEQLQHFGFTARSDVTS